MAVKTIFDLSGNVALDLANDVLHLWQPAAGGELDRKVTLQGVATLLNTNTTFTNIPYLDKENTFAENMNLDKILNIGGNPSPIYTIELYSASGNLFERIQTDGVNGRTGLRLVNDAQEWVFELAGNEADRLKIIDVTGGTVPVRIEAASPDNTLFLGPGGLNIGSLIAGVWLRGTTISLHDSIPTIESFGDWALIGRNSNSTTTNKATTIGLTHHANSQPPVVLLHGSAESGNSVVNIGGGNASGNAVTIVRIYTAANITTLTGTERERVISSGEHLIGLTAIDGTGALLQIAGDLSLRGSSDVNRSLHFASDASLAWDESEDAFIFDKNVLVGITGVDGTGALLQVGGDISLRGVADTDRTLYFASDGFILWNDDDEFFDNGNRPFVQGAIIIEGASLTENNIFDVIDTHIPNNGDLLKITGHFITSGSAYEVVYAERQSGTTIELYGISAGVLASAVINDGSGNSVTEVRLAF